MRKSLLIVLINIVFLMNTRLVFADINQDLTNYFNGLGFSSNVTSPHAYLGQEAGYYTGGSVFARNQVRDVQIATVDLPSYRAGCGGIDLFMGGFSFINDDQFIAMMKNILNNAKGYAFNLALESATPEIANTMKYINDVSNKINQTNINSCESAASLVGGVWPKTDVAQQQVCESIGTSTNIFSDWAAARQGCGVGGQRSQVLSNAKSDNRFKDLVLTQGNLAWKALHQQAFLQSDPALAELFMSLSGTVILRTASSNDDSPHHITVLPSLADNQKLLKALLYGGETTLYQCDDTAVDTCLNPRLSTVTIQPTHALQARTRVLLQSMVEKIYTDSPLTQEEIGLLESTSLPVYKMLNVQAAFTKGQSIVDVSEYADVIATDILFQYLHESVSLVNSSASTLQYPDALKQQFQQGIDKAIESVRATQRNAYSQMALSVQLIQQTQVTEQMLAGQLSTNLSNTVTWARGLSQ
jgi:conjugative transfer pilus assembly protein TraH